MKSSMYNITAHNSETRETILFNSLYGSTAVVRPEQLSIVHKVLENPSGVIADNEELSILEVLERGRFVVSDEIDELEVVRHRKKCGMSDRNRAEIILMPNLDCNFACPYCYEEHARDGLHNRH